ncbi:MAG: hypothetical protein JW751_23805 [Polyangiaceae bacterium]|nr:hypothetical protein [Polyangiaceae bacterium]
MASGGDCYLGTIVGSAHAYFTDLGLPGHEFGGDASVVAVDECGRRPG